LSGDNVFVRRFDETNLLCSHHHNVFLDSDLEIEEAMDDLDEDDAHR
jgi:hypothetical protein